MAKTKRYSDLDLDFTAHPVSGDVVFKNDAEAVKRAIRNLVMLAPNEKFFHPEIGAGIRRLLFENFSPIVKIQLEAKIKLVIENYEPRAEIQSVNATFNEDTNTFDVSVEFSVNGIPNDSFEINLPLQRLR